MQKSNLTTDKSCTTSDIVSDLDNYQLKNRLRNSCTQTNLDSHATLHSPVLKKTHIVKELSTQTSTIFVPGSNSVGSSPDISSNINHICRNFVNNDQYCNGDCRGHASKQQNCVTLERGEGDIEVNQTLMSPKALALIPFDRSFNVVNFFTNQNRQYVDDNELLSGTILTQKYLEKNRNKIKKPESELLPVLVESSPKTQLKSQSFIGRSHFYSDLNKECHTKLENYGKIHDNSKQENFFYLSVDEVTQTDKKAKSFSFMSPTIASERKNQSLEIKSIERLISPSRRARSISPRHQKLTRSRDCSCINVPFIDKSNATVLMSSHKSFRKQQTSIRTDRNSYNDLESKGSTSSNPDTALFHALCKLRDPDWNKALRGLAEIIELCKVLDTEVIYPHMTVINQRLIELIKSPRSHVSRSSCQAVGHLFEHVKDTRRPEFSELVDTLLCKCADSNKFIRHDANLALDCMVTHIPTFHTVRALCAKGPQHKNALVRTATARLLVCASVLAGSQNILHCQSNEYTRRRIILTMVGFLDDRHSDVRKYGERIYKMLSKDRIFDLYLSRYLERDVILKMKKILKSGKI